MGDGTEAQQATLPFDEAPCRACNGARLLVEDKGKRHEYRRWCEWCTNTDWMKERDDEG